MCSSLGTTSCTVRALSAFIFFNLPPQAGKALPFPACSHSAAIRRCSSQVTHCQPSQWCEVLPSCQPWRACHHLWKALSPGPAQHRSTIAGPPACEQLCPLTSKPTLAGMTRNRYSAKHLITWPSTHTCARRHQHSHGTSPPLRCRTSVLPPPAPCSGSTSKLRSAWLTGFFGCAGSHSSRCHSLSITSRCLQGAVTHCAAAGCGAHTV